MMAAAGSVQLSHKWAICKNHQHNQQLRRQDSWSFRLSDQLHRPIGTVPHRCYQLKCRAFLNPGQGFDISSMKNCALTLKSALQGKPFILKLLPAVGIVVFAVWGLAPLMRQSRNIFLHENDNSWNRSSTHYVMTSYLQPLLLWTGATLVCSALDPLVLPSEASQIVKQRLLTFVRSLSTVLAFAYCLSSVIQQAQKFFMETSDPTDTRTMGFQFAGKAIYTAVWVAAVSLFMELLGFSTQKWLTAGGLGTVLLTLAGREIFTNFLSSAMIHATRPFVVNEWIQTKIEGYEVSGTVEHVGWWSPTIVRGEDREAVHIPNHKFTVNVVRNLTQKTHWRIKTHLAISHLDVNKINNIVADMRKVLAKNSQVEHKKLHRRVFLENVNAENQALLILISCFVKTSHYEEYLCVKEAILLDLLRVISHHRARLATPIRTVQKIYSDPDLEGIPFADSVFTRGRAASNRPLLLIEPNYKINGEDKSKGQTQAARTNVEQDSKAAAKLDNKADTKGGMSQSTDSEAKEKPVSDINGIEKKTANVEEDSKLSEKPNPDTKEEHKVVTSSTSDSKLSNKTTVKSTLKSVSQKDSKSADSLSLEDKVTGTDDLPQNSRKDKQPKTGGNKAGGFPSTLVSTQENEKLPPTQPQISRPTLEENIVLGVALEGSKRTLPIEEGLNSLPTPADAKELATAGSRNASPAAAEKEKKDGQNLNVPGSASADQQKGT